MLLSHKYIGISIQGTDDHAPLHFTVTNSLIKLLKLFSFHEDIQINIEDKEGRSQLQRAIETNQIDSKKQLISHPDIDVHTTDQSFITPFLVAIEICWPKCIEVSLSHKDIDIHLKDDQGRTALEIAELLLDVASDENYSEYNQMYERIAVLVQNYYVSEHHIQSDSTPPNHINETISEQDDGHSYSEPFINETVLNEDSEILKYNLITISSQPLFEIFINARLFMKLYIRILMNVLQYFSLRRISMSLNTIVSKILLYTLRWSLIGSRMLSCYYHIQI